MKKLLAAFAVLTFAVVAHATDRTGAVALGYQASFANNSNGNWSIKYGLSSNTTLQGLVGFSINKGADNESLAVGGRLLYDLVEAENSDFYTGLGVVYNYYQDLAAGGPNDQLAVQVPLGFEFSLANAPAVAFSAEMGITYATELQSVGPASKQWTIGSDGGGLGAVFTAGAHYYF